MIGLNKSEIMADNKKGKPQQINIKLGEKEAEGIYTNMAIITHSPDEFIVDFTRVLPGVPNAKVLSRVIMTPQRTKLFLKSLQDNIRKFEQRYGEIRIDNHNPPPHPPNPFQGFDGGDPKIN